MVLVEVSEKGLGGQLYDRVNEPTGGLVLEKDQKWTKEGMENTKAAVLQNISWLRLQSWTQQLSPT